MNAVSKCGDWHRDTLSSGESMNRIDLQNLSELRIKEARILLDAASYPGAFYLAGYSVECALKACIAKETKQHDFPDRPEEVRKIYTHNLDQLLGLAKLKDKFEDDKKSNNRLDDYWNSIVNWSEEKRYELGLTEKEARDLCEAVDDPTNGVLQWLKKSW
jgi:HEPN domain-containing protein